MCARKKPDSLFLSLSSRLSLKNYNENINDNKDERLSYRITFTLLPLELRIYPRDVALHAIFLRMVIFLSSVPDKHMSSQARRRKNRDMGRSPMPIDSHYDKEAFCEAALKKYVNIAMLRICIICM